MIEVRELTKRFGTKAAVDQLSFDVRPGVVTGFLGPNGSGKSTSMRCMVGLDRANAGQTLFDGRPYATMTRPLNEVGTLLDAGYVHPGRSGRNHLRWLAASNSLPTSKVDEVLGLVGLSDVGKQRVKTYSLGMRQRLGLAGVLLGDPKIIILDEPANGLDPEGVRWIRDVLKHLAGQGRTIFVSSHLLSEMALIADDLVVIGQGSLIDQCKVAEFVEKHADRWVRVAGPDLSSLLAALGSAGTEVSLAADGRVAEIRGIEMAQLGELAGQHGTVLHELSLQTGSLEDAYLKATAGSVEYAGGTL
jgi:ABC-2 type transport system ATP-binding protein